MSLTSVGSADTQLIRYRADIDGLRAIAVLSVVFYHFSHRLLPGGYLGVDIFFVISGFLITSILWRQIQDGEFSIVGFYDRRIRRIVPALLLALVLVTLVASALLLPADLVGYSRSMLATLGFFANVYFWRDTDYFSRLAEEKPLLHLWSLSVEEQFYIAFPLLLALLVKFWQRGALLVISMLILGSFALNVLALKMGGSSPAFFLLPTRAWELGLGAFVAMLPARSFPRASTAEALGFLGLFLVFAGLLHPSSVSQNIPTATSVVMGVTLLILAGQHERPVATRFLTLLPFVSVGLISYSLYLWHWPILVLGQYYLIREFSSLEAVAAFTLMMVCAIVSWHFIERPFRAVKTPIHRVRYFALAGVVVLAAAASVLLGTKGLPGRLDSKVAVINSAVGTNYRCPMSNYLAFGASRACWLNSPSRDPKDADVVLLGNSHVQMYAPAWEDIFFDRGLTGLLVPLNGCLPTVQINITEACIDAARANLNEIVNLKRATAIILGLTWDHGNDLVDATGRPANNVDNRALVAALDDLIDKLHRAGKQVVLIGPIASPGWDVASIVSRQLAFKRLDDRPHSVPRAEFVAKFGLAIRHFESRHDIGFVRPDRVQCPADNCEYLLDGRSLFADSNHIAVRELSRFRPLFEAALMSLNRPGFARHLGA